MPLASSPAACSSAHPPSFCASSASYKKYYCANISKRHHRLLALPEPQAAASVLVAGIVGVSATLLLRRSSSSQEQQQQQGGEEAPAEENGEECWDCGGTGLCGRCKGEGFVFKQLSEDTATKARKAAKNMATRYTAGYVFPSSCFNSIIYLCSLLIHAQASHQVDLLQQVLLHPLLHNLPRIWQN